ncbi:exodeoxyribonuclease V subunit alpha [Symbioplanes lichenis]|uniref:exodeoxyribonuclease V subunit alpha n=1 Tax=Symbioplanes lichenis TaxID=1629072 RepID=UPI002739EF27|nr:exodeoxyribonuclease V subunit alpha [Actinoplanes lichenis]
MTVTLAHRATGLLQVFNVAGILDLADVHTADRVARLGGETDDGVRLAVALTVRALRLGSVCLDLPRVHLTTVTEEPVALPWPEPESWLAACRRSPLVACDSAPGDGNPLAARGNAPGDGNPLAAFDGAPGTSPGVGRPLDRAGRPLRLVGDLLYLDRYWRQEDQVRHELLTRAAGPGPDADPDRLRADLDRLFPDGGSQRLAAAVSTLRHVSVLAGGPGTGKTTTIARLLAVLAAQPTSPELAQPSPADPGRPSPAQFPGTDPGRPTSAEPSRLSPEPAQSPGTDPDRPTSAEPGRLSEPGRVTRPGGSRLRIALAAPTGKAAARLEEAVREVTATLPDADRATLGELHASTIHRLLGRRPGSHTRFRHDRSNRLPYDVVVVDETSMVSLTLMARLLEAVRPEARLILVGDPDQLASVEAGAVLGDIVRAGGPPEPALHAALTAAGVLEPGRRIHNGVVTLTRTWRFGGAIAALATAVRTGNAEAALAVLISGDPAVEFTDPADVDGLRTDAVTALRAVSEAAVAGDAAAALTALDTHRLLCAHREGPYGVTRWTREIARWLDAPAGADLDLGRPLLITANDYDSGLYNGDTGVIVGTPDGPRAAFARGGTPVLVPPSRLSSAETLYALTVHRSQGSQFGRVTLVLPEAGSPLLTRELLYTAVTRARTGLRILGTPDAIRAAVARPVARATGLRDSLAAPASAFAEPTSDPGGAAPSLAGLTSNGGHGTPTTE